jgi:hypothetical protein
MGAFNNLFFVLRDRPLRNLDLRPASAAAAMLLAAWYA